MSNFQAVMLPANTFQLPPLWFFIVYRALSGHQEDWGTVTLFSRWEHWDLESPWDIPNHTRPPAAFSMAELGSELRPASLVSLMTSGHLAKVTSLGLGQTFFIQIFSFPCSCQYQQICRKLSDPDLCRLRGEKTWGEAEQEKVDRRHLAGGREKAVEHSVHILCSAEPLLPHQ